MVVGEKSFNAASLIQVQDKKARQASADWRPGALIREGVAAVNRQKRRLPNKKPSKSNVQALTWTTRAAYYLISASDR